MYGFRKILKGTESGCHIHPYFVRGKPENLQLIKRGAAAPSCLLSYQNWVHKVSDVKTEEVQDDNSRFSEPEMVLYNRGRKRTKDTLPLPYYVPTELNGHPSEHMEKRRKQHSGHDGTNGKPKEEMWLLSNDEGQKRCEGRKRRLIPVMAGGGVQGEPKVVNGATSAVIEARNATGSGEASNQRVHNFFPPGGETLPTNSSGGKNARNVRYLGTYKQEQQQQQHQHQCELGNVSLNSISSSVPLLSKNSSYTDLLEHLKVMSESYPSLITTISDIGPPSGVSEDWQNFYPCHFSSSSSRDTSSALLDLMEVANSLETQYPSAIQNDKYNSESAAESTDSFVSIHYSSSTLRDLAEVADSLASQRTSLSKSQQDIQSINDVQNGHFYMNDESQFEQKQQFDASVVGKSMLKADHDVTKANEDPSVVDALSLAISLTTKRDERNFEQQQLTTGGKFGHAAAVADSRVEKTLRSTTKNNKSEDYFFETPHIVH